MRGGRGGRDRQTDRQCDRQTDKQTETETEREREISHLQENNLSNPFLSAYRAGHSTETVLLRIVNDILSALDNDNISVLLLLDISAAF